MKTTETVNEVETPATVEAPAAEAPKATKKKSSKPKAAKPKKVAAAKPKAAKPKAEKKAKEPKPEKKVELFRLSAKMSDKDQIEKIRSARVKHVLKAALRKENPFSIEELVKSCEGGFPGEKPGVAVAWIVRHSEHFVKAGTR